MSNLNTQWSDDPMLWTTRYEGPPLHKAGRMSAFAAAFLEKLGTVSGNLVRKAKMIPLAFLAVCALNVAQAQVYNTNFDATLFAATHLGASTPTGGNIAFGDGCGGTNGHSMASGPYSLSYTFTVDPGYKLDISQISVAALDYTATDDAISDNLQISVNASAYGSLWTGNLSSVCQNVVRTVASNNLTGSFTVTFTGSSSTNIGLDDIQINGVISCNNVAALAISGVSGCGTGAVTIGGVTSAGVNYQLYKDNVATGINMNGNGSGSITFSGLAAGSYTAKGVNIADNSCVTDMTGGPFIIKKAPALFTVGGGGNICSSPAGGNIAVTLSGSEAGVSYQLKNNGVNVGAAMAGNGSPLSWMVSAASTGSNYTVDAVVSPTVCAAGMTGAAVVTVSLPSASITGNNGEFCSSGGNGVWTLIGTPNAIVTYTVSGGAPGAPYNGSINIQPDGTASIIVNGITGSTTVTLNLATNTTGSNSCTQNLTATNMLTVRPALAISNVLPAANQFICSGGSFSNLTFSVSGSGYTRTVYYRLNATPGTVALTSSATSGVIPVGSLATINAGPADLVHMVYIDSVKYVSAPSCVSTVGATSRTLTVRANPTFTFNLNGVPLTPGSSDTVCVPVGSFTFTVSNLVNASPGNFVIVKDNVTLGSGAITSGTASLLPQINFDPAGNYSVTVNGPNCSTTLNYTVYAVPKPSFTYIIAGQAVTQGAVIQVCANSSSAVSLSGNPGNTYVVTGPGSAQFASPINASGTDTWTIPATAAGSYAGSLKVNTNPLFSGGCDSTITYSVQVNPNPGSMVNVNVNGGSNLNFVSPATYPANERAICENTSNSINIVGTPGYLIEMFSNYGRSEVTDPGGSSVTMNQVGTYIIPASGTFTYTFNSGAYNGSTDESTLSTSSRNYYRVEVKNPTTLCASTIDFRLYIKQKPRVNVGWTITGASAPGTLVNEGDTIKICYPAQVRFYFNRGASNDAELNATLSYVFKKDGVTAGTGTITTSPVSYYEFPVAQGASGMYTLMTTSSNGCDSLRTFYVKAYSGPKYTFSQGATVNPTSISFCEGYAATKPITLVSDSAALSQTYTIVRTGGTGTHTFTTLSGSLTATAVNHILSTLGTNGNQVGTHIFTLTVTSNPNACASVRTFTVNVTPMPKPVLKANTVTMVHGQTYNYCEEEVVEYRISGVPNGSTYTLTRANSFTPLPVTVATGTTIQAEQSVVTFAMAPNTAGLYTLKVTNSGSSTCDSLMSFTVNVNDRPDITNLVTSNVSVCNGNNNGSVTYTYTAMGVGSNNTITRKLYRNGVEISNQDNTNLSGTITNPNLLSGNYLLVVSNASCSDSATFSITDPASALVLTVTNTGAACGSNNGTATLSFSGGVGPYQLQIFDPANLPVSTQSNVAATANWNVYNLAPGVYTVKVTDQLGCMKSQTFTINSCTVPDLFPFATVTPSNYSLSNTSNATLVLNIYNNGQTTSSGNVSATITLPSGFALSGSNPGWTLTQLGTSSVYFVSSATAAIVPGIGTPAVLTFSLTDPGAPGTGFYAIISSVGAGSGGEINTTNNSTITLLNVNP